MTIWYTKHARERMAQRQISDNQVQNCLRSPEVTYPDGHGNMNFVCGGIRVVALVDNTTRKVITVVRL